MTHEARSPSGRQSERRRRRRTYRTLPKDHDDQAERQLLGPFESNVTLDMQELDQQLDARPRDNDERAVDGRSMRGISRLITSRISIRPRMRP